MNQFNISTILFLTGGTLKRRKRPNKWEEEPTSNIELDDCTAFLQKSTHFFFFFKKKKKNHML